ncbi:hypothetical protein EHO61_02540 [Leptospira fluminis]|uniref:Zinc-ribbon domain-containing protein n=1 Tax=Leptospira fluminis TaxID=2484979 RepID=A0A4R9GTA8_9LEPT|nr:hypothetical protein [Leptospira fluminis]TGK20767.1 hypothetical protein EHO61_02540 [Leptospira fluminis]
MNGLQTPHCQSCGTDRNSSLTKVIKTYSNSAWFLILFGISSKPKEVRFQCSKCGEIFDQLSPQELEHYT